MLKKLLPWIKGLLTSYGICLGNVSPAFLISWIVCSFFYIYMDEKDIQKKSGYRVLALVWALLIPLGQTLKEYSALSPAFTNPLNVISTIVSIAGFYFAFDCIIPWIADLLSGVKLLSDRKHFFSEKAFLKCFVILEAVYLLAVLLNFPGNLCYDTEGQIEQVLGMMPYSAHHPLLSTFILGLPVKVGLSLTGSLTIGIFFCLIVQITMLAAALAYSISWLAGKKLSLGAVTILMLVYALAPIYTNMASTAIKDVSFISAFIVYFVCLLRCISDETLLKNPKFLALFILFQTLTGLLRKNGLYVIVLTGIILCFINIKKGARVFLKKALSLFIAGAVAATLIDTALISGLGAQKGSGGEALSLPLQITARYIKEYEQELTDREKEAIAGLLGNDFKNIGDRYNPLLSDAVKAIYNKEAGVGELTTYLISFTGMFFKHPWVYIEGFLTHTYGWYCPTVSTATRYETNADDFYVPLGITAFMDKVMIFLYRYADGISLLGLMQNAAFYVWGLWFYTAYFKKRKLKQATVPLWISLLVCFMAPGFMEHTRYAFPIIIAMPILYIYTLSEREAGDETDEKA